ncbi:MAG TPA: protein phosphatase 2C domain-containing protein, partial [Gallionella sp.]|nr:protein phosphatase 2C domain-containing protein [Gallionella sp.]
KGWAEPGHYITITSCEIFPLTMNFSIHQASHIGNRRFNQDRVAYVFSNEILLLVLADGMGGHLHGELAAGMTIDTFVEAFGQVNQPQIADPDKFILDAMQQAHDRIMSLPHDNDMGGFPGTTCVAALIQDGKMYWGHAGDSRLYLLRDGKVAARTTDHSIVQHWVETGQITAEEARVHPQRNHITHCLGGIEDVFYMEHGKPLGLQSGDVLLLGSDGLWGPFTDSELADAFADEPVAFVLDVLIETAVQRESGHSDNATGLVVRWGEHETRHDSAVPVSHVLEIS